MMAYGRSEARERLSRLIEHPRSLALTGPLTTIIVNTLLILVGIGGLTLTAHGSRAGQSIVFAAMLLSNTYLLLLRAKSGSPAAPDERERMVTTEAAAVGGYAASMLIACWCLLLGPFADQGLWFPQQPMEWQALGFFMIGLVTQITNIAAAWRTPPYVAELLDED